MMNLKARLIVIAVAVILLGWTLYERTYEVSAFIAFAIAYLAWAHFRQGSVALAAKAYHNQDLEKAQKLLQEVRNPDRLARNRRGYYEFIMGNLELKKNNFAAAETHFQIASRFPLRNENDKGFVLVQLANLNLRKREFEKAQAYVDVAKDLKISSRVKDIIQKIENEIQKSR